MEALGSQRVDATTAGVGLVAKVETSLSHEWCGYLLFEYIACF